MSMGQDDEASIGGLSERCLGGGAVGRLLLREFSHRINNELTSAIGLVSVAASRCDSNEARATLAVVKDRLQSFAGVQHSLQMPEYDTTIDLAAYLEQLCRSTSHSKLESKGIELSLSVTPLKMRSERCWFLGMIVYELITNAARHAFRDDGGAIHLEIRPTGTSVRCAITDNGCSDVDPVRGKGLSIIQALAEELDGLVDMQFGPNGTMTIVSFPHGA
jgi:two-component sensor histidine kinase